MIVEVIDEHSGAILFKKDEESLTIERLDNTVKVLIKKIDQLEERIKELERQ